jgi:hypothetical protein
MPFDILDSYFDYDDVYINSFHYVPLNPCPMKLETLTTMFKDPDSAKSCCILYLLQDIGELSFRFIVDILKHIKIKPHFDFATCLDNIVHALVHDCFEYDRILEIKKLYLEHFHPWRQHFVWDCSDTLSTEEPLSSAEHPSHTKDDKTIQQDPIDVPQEEEKLHSSSFVHEETDVPSNAFQGNHDHVHDCISVQNIGCLMHDQVGNHDHLSDKGEEYCPEIPNVFDFQYCQEECSKIVMNECSELSVAYPPDH